MQEVTASSWSELIELLFDDSYNAKLQRFRSPYVFRGLPRRSYALSTTLSRLGGPYAELERHLLRNFRKYAPRTSVESDTPWHWLALGQQHGLPTRLLDWTFSPLVALHFATSEPDRYDEDAQVLALDHGRVNEFLPDSLKAELCRESSELLTVEMLSRALRDLGELSNAAPEPFLVLFEPPTLTERFAAQFALFSMMSRADSETEAWLVARPPLCRRIVIPACLKWEVRDKLDQANITERMLMPGLDGLSCWLRRYYTARG